MTRERLRRLGRVLPNLFGRARFERDLGDELESAVAELQAEGEAKGLAPEEARRRARVALGVEQVKESVRDERSGASFNRLALDARFALRSLKRSPGYAAVAIATLALGIGGTTAIFSVARAAAADPPYPDSDRLMHVWAFWPGGNGNFGYPDFVAMLEQNRSFEKLAAYEAWGGVALTGGERPVLLETSFVTADYFDLVGARARLGRLIRPEENALTSSSPVAVVSAACWKRALGSDPAIVGKPIRLNGVPHTVVGVLEPGFLDLGMAEGGVAPDVFLPAASAPALLGQPPLTDVYSIYWGLGRLKPGVTIEQARQNLAEVAERRAKESPANRTEHGLDLRPLGDRVTGPVRKPATLVLAGSALILLLGCVNLANATLVRLGRRSTEMAMRSALGATSSRLTQQLLIEASVVAALGGVLGVLIAIGLTYVLGRWIAENVAALVAVRVDVAVLLCALALSAGTVLLFGLLPALAGRRVDLRGSLAGGATRGASERRGGARGGLVVAEIALATVLLVAAGLMGQSFVRLFSQGLGFDTQRLLTFRADLPNSRYAEPAARARFAHELARRLESVPGVSSATLWGPSMLSNATWVVSVFPAEREPSGPSDFVQLFRHSVNPEALANLGIPLVAGRAFDEHDDLDSPLVAIVSERVARQLWPGEDAVGKLLRRIDPSLPPIRVVGVSADARHRNRYSLDDLAVGWPPGGVGPQRDVYFPYAQRPNPSLTMALRIDGESGAVAARVRDAMAELDGELPISDLALLDDRLAAQQRAPRMIASLFAGFAAFSLLLAALGVYGVVAQSVDRRAREFGIRVALGARPGEIVRGVVRGGAALGVLGLALGLAAAAGVARLLSSFLVEVEAFDPATFAVVPVALLATTLLTSYVPIRAVMARGARGAIRALREG